MEHFALKVVRDLLVEFVLFLRGQELLCQWHALREPDVFKDLFAEGSAAECGEPTFQFDIAAHVVGPAEELLTKRDEGAEDGRVDDGDEAVELEERVLKRRRGEENRGCSLDRADDRVRHLVLRLFDVSKTMRFVDHDEIPRRGPFLFRLRRSEVVRAEDDAILDLERILRAVLLREVERPCFEDRCWDGELLLHLLLPLFSERRGNDEKNSAPALGPALRDDDPRLDRFPEPDFVREEHAFREGRTHGEECGVDLVRVQIHARIRDGPRKVLHSPWRTLERQGVRPARTVVRRLHVSWMVTSGG